MHGEKSCGPTILGLGQFPPHAQRLPVVSLGAGDIQPILHLALQSEITDLEHAVAWRSLRWLTALDPPVVRPQLQSLPARLRTRERQMHERQRADSGVR